MKARSAPGAPACAQPATAAELAHPTPDKREDRATAKRPRPEATPASSEVALVPQRDAPSAPAPRPVRAARPAAAAAAAWLRKLGEMHPACRAIPADEVIALALELFKSYAAIAHPPEGEPRAAAAAAAFWAAIKFCAARHTMPNATFLGHVTGVPKAALVPAELALLQALRFDVCAAARRAGVRAPTASYFAAAA